MNRLSAQAIQELRRDYAELKASGTGTWGFFNNRAKRYGVQPGFIRRVLDSDPARCQKCHFRPVKFIWRKGYVMRLCGICFFDMLTKTAI